MCVADRLAVLWAFVVGFLLVLVGHQDPNFLGNEGVLFLIFTLPVWGFLRLLDWVTGGPKRRKLTVYYH